MQPGRREAVCRAMLAQRDRKSAEANLCTYWRWWAECWRSKLPAVGKSETESMSAGMQGKVMVLHGILRSRSGKVFVTCWVMSALSLIGFAFFGVFDRDLASAIAVGVLVAAPFTDVAVVASYWAGRASAAIAMATWLTLAAALLGGTLWLLQNGHADADLLLVYGVSVLSFPMGLISGPLTAQLSWPAGRALTTALWVVAIGAGFLQWFVLIPMLLKARAKDLCRS